MFVLSTSLFSVSCLWYPLFLKKNLEGYFDLMISALCRIQTYIIKTLYPQNFCIKDKRWKAEPRVRHKCILAQCNRIIEIMSEDKYIPAYIAYCPGTTRNVLIILSWDL